MHNTPEPFTCDSFMATCARALPYVAGVFLAIGLIAVCVALNWPQFVYAVRELMR